MIRWLLGPTIASAIFAFIAIRIFDAVFSGATSTLASVARPTIFAGTWSATTATSGMRGITSRVRSLRAARDRIDSVLTREEDESLGDRDD